MKNKRVLTFFCMLCCCSTFCSQSQTKSNTSEWPSYGNDPGGTRFVNLTQINKQNVKQLKQAWVYRTGELATYEGTSVIEKAAFEATPLMVDGVLYFSTPTCRVIALDAATGKQQWIYDPKINLKTDYSEITSRGVSHWPLPGNVSSVKDKRIFIATLDGRLIALDAKTGKTIASFGSDGTVNLREGFNRDWSITSPPAINGNVIIVGSSMGDNQKVDYPKGTVRGYDVLNGKLLWSWDPVPSDTTDKAIQTWNTGMPGNTGAANAWAVISADPNRDLVYIPTSSPAPDYYGGERKGQNLYANSIVALKASTGKMIWYFQVVHHDLWDYDIAAQPVLFDMEKDGKKIPAVAIGTKMGHIFILDRENGASLFPIEERNVPVSQIAGEESWKTQPFPLLPAPVGLQRISEADAWGLTPADKEASRERIKKYHHEGSFTPVTSKGSIITPGNVGGIHWGGMCYDSIRKLLITNINRLAAVIKLIPREEMAQYEKDDSTLLRTETGRQNGTPYIMKRDYLFKRSADGFRMQTAPPWGTLLAIDMNSGNKKWEVPLGYMLDPAKYPDARTWGSLNFGGAIVTASGVTFVAASLDSHLRAFDTDTGQLLWESALPAGGQATPMSYAVDGKQYVVIAAGGHGKLGTKQGDFLITFSLPDGK